MLKNFKKICVTSFNKLRPIFTGIGFVVLFLVLSFFSYAFYDSVKNTKNPAPNDNNSVSNTTDIKDSNCNIMGINLHGNLLTYIPLHADNDTTFNYDSISSENIIEAINQANKDQNIKAIIVEIDSGGGSAVAGEEIANAVKISQKPVVAYIRGQGDSAAYWAISSASQIFASKNSDVGSIGITGSYLSNAIKDKKDGYTFEQLNSGKYKDSGSFDKPLTEEERKLFMRDINIMYYNFMEDVSKNRNIPLDKVKTFSDGSTVLGAKAKELGLIDQIGGIIEAKQYLKNITGEEQNICW